MRIINIDKYAEAILKISCGDTRFSEISAEWFEMKAFEIAMPKGFKFPENYPACCVYHTNLVNTMRETFDRFPQCCSAHKKMLATSWFSKEDYRYIETKVGNQILFSKYMIVQQIHNIDWFEDITDYIDYNYASFGQFPTGYGPALGLNQYLTGLKNEVDSLEIPEVETAKKKRLLEFIDGLTAPIKSINIDLSQLETTYKNWLKIFPFEISYFKELRNYFENTLPVLKGKPTTNRYSNVTKIKILTQSDFVIFLNTLTKNLLDKVNSHVLVTKGVITDVKKHSIELLSANHKITQTTTLSKFSEGEQEYVDVLRAWLSNEKIYFAELANLVSTNIAEQVASNIQFPRLADEGQFEDFVCDLYNAEFPGALYQKFGKKGNTQKGIDIVSIRRKEAIQCKKKEVSRAYIAKELKEDFESDATRALELEMEVDRLIFASTHDDSAELIEYAATLKRRINTPFDITYIGWQTLSAMLRRQQHLIIRYYGESWGLNPNNTVSKPFLPQTYLLNIPPIVYKAYVEAHTMWDTGVTSEMLEGNNYLSNQLFSILIDLAIAAFPPAHFHGMEPEAFFHQKIGRLMDSAYAAQPKQPGTMHIVIASGQRAEIIKEYIVRIVKDATAESFFAFWKASWDRAIECNKDDSEFDK